MFWKLAVHDPVLEVSRTVAHEAPCAVVTPGNATTFESTSGE